ncbi:MAG: Stealth CR1 domain-containing protein [Kiritimatiellae bacterium]|nr:Stealth CR1 domain-containing protein [Kiritimatiellia bacterium]
MAESSGIDFVITWVDGADPAWRRERNSYASDGGFGCSEARFRDWELLRYWFRGVERFAPWVDKIHFVTWGHVPAWLKCDHPKIRIVNHRDFIPREYLPTFNSNAIELNMHRIPELAEQFVYFNDDVFLLRRTEPRFFFRHGLPRDFFCLDAPKFATGTLSHSVGEDMAAINDLFTSEAIYAKNRLKMLSPTLGLSRIRRNIAMKRMFRRFVPGFENRHTFLAFRRQTLADVWGSAGGRLDDTCRNRFRGRLDVNIWLVRYWHLAKGEYFCGAPDECRCAHLTASNAARWAQSIRAREYTVVCANDNALLDEFETTRDVIAAAFAAVFPDRCSFEREDAP